MFKILLTLLLICPSAWAAGQWRNGTGEQTILGASQAALIGYNSYNSIVKPIDNLESDHCTEWLQYVSSSTITVVAGTCVVSNSQGTIRLFMQDTANTTITSTNLDTGSITASTTYYVYATAATNTSTSSTYYISTSNTAPSGQTYYYQIGSFLTDANSQFTGIINENSNRGSLNQLLISKGNNVTYQALTDLYFGCYGATGGSSQNDYISTGSISGSLTQVQQMGNGNNSFAIYTSMGWNIRKGDYYEETGNYGAICYAVPTSL